MRLNQFVASSTRLSRRSADEAIRDGRVRVNGEVGQLGARVAPADEVSLDGRKLIAVSHHDYILFHKPVGYVTSRARQGSAPTIYDLIPARYRSLQAVGRLDKDSSCLLLLTNDGGFAQAVSHPSFAKEKVYQLTLNQELTATNLKRLEQGIELEDGMSRLKVLSYAGRELTVSLTEGRNRQIRRTLTAIGYRVKRLHRMSFGPYLLGDLGVGKVADFTPEARN